MPTRRELYGLGAASLMVRPLNSRLLVWCFAMTSGSPHGMQKALGNT